MGKMTVSVPDDVLKKFKEQCPELNPAEVVRKGIIEKLEELEKFEILKNKGLLESKKFEKLIKKLEEEELI